MNLLASKRITIARLKKLLSGAHTETTEAVLSSVAIGATPAAAGNRIEASPSRPCDAPSKRRKGHGRNGADDYRGAERIGRCTS